ncbi:MAG: hypothetical protein AB1705_24590 [Verrucomicrobiota bacterium]
MKPKYPLAVIVTSLLLAGCEPPKSSEPPSSSGTTMSTPEVKQSSSTATPPMPENPTPATRTPATPATPTTEMKKESSPFSPTGLANPQRTEVRDTYVTAMEEKLKKMDELIASLSEKAVTLDENSEARKALESLREQRTQLGRKFDAVKQSSQDTWIENRSGFDTALTEFEKSYETTKTKFGGY